jgi:hypothetical protein
MPNHDKKKVEGWSRREFLRRSLLGGGAMLISPSLIGLRPKSLFSSMPQSIVVIVIHDNATTGPNINEPVVQVMMDAAIKELTSQSTVGDAWLSLFPGLTTSNTISTKVNCINSNLASHPEVANCINNGLTQMQIGPEIFPDNNIITWDRTDGELMNSGYTINDTSTGPRCFATNHSGIGYASSPVDVNGVSSYPSSIVTDHCDEMISLAVLKDHGMAGITLSLKNHYGSIHNPSSLHSSNCDPWIAALNRAIRDDLGKLQKVSIIDALFGIYNGGPGGSPQFVYNGLILSTDPVACDYEGMLIINQERASHGYGPVNAPHVQTAADYGLGTNDPAHIDVRWIINPGIEESEPPSDTGGGFYLFQNRPNPCRSKTEFPFRIPNSSPVALDIYDKSGVVVRRIRKELLSPGNHSLLWDLKNDKGASVTGGTYLYRLTINNGVKTGKLTVIR